MRKSHDIGSSYSNQHIKKKSFEISADDWKNIEKDKKNINPIKSKPFIATTTINYTKTKENRLLTPNSKEQMKFEGKVKKSVQRQFLKTGEEKKNNIIKKK